MSDDYGTSEIGGNICSKCGKPYYYIGDIIGNVEDLICTCYKETSVLPTWIDVSSPKGWICPKCGRVFSPTTIECPYCNTLPSQNDYWKDNSSGIRITFS